MIHRHTRRGSNAIEFALVAPVLVLVVTGIIDFGWYFFAQQTLSNATLDSARIASVTAWEDSPTATLERELESRLSNTMLDSETSRISATYVGSPPSVKLVVDAASEFPVLLGLIPLPPWVDSQMTLLLEDQPSDADWEDENWPDEDEDDWEPDPPDNDDDDNKGNGRGRSK